VTRMMLSLKRVTNNGQDCKRGFAEYGTLKSDKSASSELGGSEDITPLFLQLKSLKPRDQSTNPTRSGRGKQMG
jgi:hypothetical protein